MRRDGVITFVPTWVPGREAMRCIIILCAFAMISIAVADLAHATNGDKADEVILLPSDRSSSSKADLSYSSSTIQMESRSNNSRAPLNISAGNGYYSAHPINYDSASVSRTQLSAAGLYPASLDHSVDSAKEISGFREYTVSGRSYRDQEGGSTKSSTTIGMKISETVTEGKVHIGAFQADTPSGGREGMNPRRSPAFEMEEEYIGTYHISKNMTFSSNNIMHKGADCWLGCDNSYLNYYPSNPLSISASDVFDCIK